MTNEFALVLLDAGGAGSAIPQLLFFGAIFIVMYFFMIRPQQKKAKEQKNFRETLKKGDFVQTLGGIHGKIYSIESDDTVWLEVDTKGTRLKVEKAGIGSASDKTF
ncbi:MAG: protein translocase subunit yajC [Chitinophagaceae bacterium]|nr:protein translocase subunit yajC [Chitinophagaceae bacterium]